MLRSLVEPAFCELLESGEAYFNLGFRWTMEAAEAATSALQNARLALARL